MTLPERPTAPKLSNMLCRDAVRIRKEARQTDGRSNRKHVLMGELSGIRLALALLHGWDDYSHQGPAGQLIVEWWETYLPEDWTDGTAWANQLHFELHELLASSTAYRTIAELSAALAAPTSTSYRVFSAPEETMWETVATYVKALGGRLSHFEKLWRQAQLRGS